MMEKSKIRIERHAHQKFQISALFLLFAFGAVVIGLNADDLQLLPLETSGLLKEIHSSIELLMPFK
ncbi:MAG: hypothetical protein R2769_06180 [Saprospiraceae bacterium]